MLQFYRSEDANCEVVFIGEVGALVAKKTIKAGDWLSVCPSDDEDDEDDDEDDEDDEDE